jgi:hypothetical protein
MPHSAAAPSPSLPKNMMAMILLCHCRARARRKSGGQNQALVRWIQIGKSAEDALEKIRT